MDSILNALKNLSAPVKWFVGAGLVITLGLLLWFGVLTKAWNGIGNFFFHRQANELSEDVKKQLATAAEQKKAFEQTLLELAKSKEALAAAKKESEILRGIFNDDAKTASQKLAAYKAALAVAPTVTDPTGVTTEQLCERAKATGGSPQLIAALCPAG